MTFKINVINNLFNHDFLPGCEIRHAKIRAARLTFGFFRDEPLKFTKTALWIEATNLQTELIDILGKAEKNLI